jgi:acetyl esterase
MNRVPLNPRLAELLRESAKAGRRSTSSSGVAASRAQIEARPRPDDVPLAAVVDESMEHAGHEIRLRIYEPFNAEGGTIVYAHGGGWAVGSVDSFDGITQRIALYSGARVVSVDYRLAPEHPFPAGLDDVAAVLERTVERFGQPVAVAGDSAGANLAAVLARRDRDSGRHAVCAQLLIYPVADSDTTRPSYAERPDDVALANFTSEDMDWFWSQYVPDVPARSDPDVAPLRASSLAGLAPAIVVVAGHDPLRDEGCEYAHRLSAAGVDVQVHEHADLCHGFLAFLGRLPEADNTIERVSADLGVLLRRST